MIKNVPRADHPGKTLLDFLEDRGWNQREFAQMIGKSPVEINYIIKGTKDINVDFAIRFSIAFNTSPNVWLGIQRDYDVYKLNLNKKNDYKEIKNRVRELAFV